MKKLAIAAIVVAALAVVTSGAALWRTRDLSKSTKTNTSESSGPSTTTGPTVDVPDMTNKTGFSSVQALALLDLKSRIVRAPSDTVAKANVISQNPAPGTKVPPGTQVQLNVSTGPLSVSTVPP